ncbi:MAG: DoxX family protein [Prevotellaceae bacterium]|jgi:uncharacterized membrane protein YphA (DoxX/SURF4 family)|nr:DoxX family protein [Prevotellaceae bacterium]
MSRLLLVSAFLLSGYAKSVDPLGTVYKLQDYLTAFGMAGWFSDSLLVIAAVALSSFEFLLGIALLFGIHRYLSAWITFAFMGVMTPLTFYLWLTNPIHDCGCFGDAWVLTNGETFAKNIVLLLAAASICWRPRYMVRFVTEKMQWLVGLCSMFFIIGLSAYCYRYLPILDFRPYKVGAHFSADGFALTAPNPDNLPQTAADTTYIDFYALNETDEDITLNLLTDTTYVFLLVSSDLSKADDDNIDLFNGVYDYAVNHHYPFYCLTASPPEIIEQWKDRTGAEYPFAVADEITLKTMIRSNPGLIMLRAGTIVQKWSNEEIPDIEELTAPMSELQWAEPHIENTWVVVGRVFAGYVFILLLIILSDGLFEWIKYRRKISRSERQITNSDN